MALFIHIYIVNVYFIIQIVNIHKNKYLNLRISFMIYYCMIFKFTLLSYLVFTKWIYFEILY